MTGAGAPTANLATRVAPSLVVRAPNHLGDLVMALPALEAAGTIDVLVAGAIAPLLAMAHLDATVIPLTRGAAGFARAVAELRRGRYAQGVLLTPSFSSALLFAAGGVRERRGTDTDARHVLLTERVPSDAFADRHRSAAYWALVSNSTIPQALVPRLTVSDEAKARWRALSIPDDGPLIGLFPGGHAPARRWSPASFATLAMRLVARGAQVVVFGGPAERTLTARVAGTRATDLGGRTDLALLAAGLAACDLVVSNDSGPLHVAAAVGTPTISCWGAGDPRVTGPLGRAQRIVRHAELPCVPCTRNVCPRRGRGTELPDAHNECLALITVDEVDSLIPLAS
jgi:lipopolysaccharide heptosyltransferase II